MAKVRQLSAYKIVNVNCTSDTKMADDEIPLNFEILSDGDDNTLCLYHNKRKPVERFDLNEWSVPLRVHRIGDQGKWLISLNSKVKEPVITICVNDEKQAALLDTGSCVNILSRGSYNRLLSGGLIPNDQFVNPKELQGPGGENLLCNDVVNFTFTIGNCRYSDIFYVLESFENILILGYPFMNENNIIIRCGQFVTNDPQYKFLDSEKRRSSPNNLFMANPIYDYEVSANSVRHVLLKVDAQPAILENYFFTPFIVKKCCADECGQCVDKLGEVALLRQDGVLEYKFKNKYNLGICIEESDQFFCIPITRENPVRKSIGDRVHHIGPKDFVHPITEVEDVNFFGLHSEGYSTPNMKVQHGGEFETEGKGIPLDMFLKSHPCTSCKTKYPGRERCSFENGCVLQADMLRDSESFIKNEDVQENKLMCNVCVYSLFNQSDQVCLLDCDRHHNENCEKKITLVEGSRTILINSEKIKVVVPHENTETSVNLKEVMDRALMLMPTPKNTTILIGCPQCFASTWKFIQERYAESKIIRTRRSDDSNSHCMSERHRDKESIRNTKYVSVDKMVPACDIMSDDPEIVKSLIAIIEKHDALFSKHPFDIGHVIDPVTKEPLKFCYRLRKDAIPYVAKFRPIAPQMRPAAEEIITNLLENGIIVKALSPWCANSVWVLKPPRSYTKEEMLREGKEYIPNTPNLSAERSLRLAVNFKQVNTFLYFPVFPLPGVKSLLSNLRGATTISLIDLTMAYWSLELSKQSSLLTGFSDGIDSDAILCFKRAPMGLTSSGSLLSASLHSTLESIKKNCIHYSDNLILMSSRAEHVRLVDKCFELLLAAGYKMKKAKSILFCEGKLKVLGVVFDTKHQRVYADPTKILALKHIDYPASVDQLKSFLGGVNFILETIPGIADDLAILYHATRKKKEFVFGTKEKASFDRIKDTMTKPDNFLYFHDYSKPLLLKVDTSTIAVGFCLLQVIDGVTLPLGFYSKVLSEAQQKYGSSHREALGVSVALRLLESQIRGTFCTVFVDCRALLCISHHANSNSKMARYMSYLQSFVPELRFVWNEANDKQFRIADLLSRPGYMKTNPITNRMPSATDEVLVATRAQKLAAADIAASKFPILMDFILSLPDDDLSGIQNGSVYINRDLKIVLKDSSGKERILSNDRYGVPIDENRENYYRCSTVREVCNVSFSDSKPYVDDDMANEPAGGCWSDEENELFAVRNIKESAYAFDVEDNTTLKDLNKDVNDSILESLDLTTHVQRFLHFIIMKYPFLDLKKLSVLQAKDPGFKDIVEACRNSVLRTYEDKMSSSVFELVRDILIRKTTDQNGVNYLQIVMPKFTVMDTLLFLHRSLYNAHCGASRMAKLYSRDFYTPNIDFFCSLVCSNCRICTVNKPGRKTRGDYLSKLKVTVTKPGVLFFSDVIKISNHKHAKYTHLVTWTCCVSNFLVCKPFKDSISSEQFLEMLDESVIRVFPNFRYLVVDNAKDISSTVVRQYLNSLNILLVTTSAYSSKSNKSEIIQRWLLQAIRINRQEALISSDQWDLVLTQSVLSLNNTPFEKGSFNTTPFNLMFNNMYDGNFVATNPELLDEAGYLAWVVQTAKGSFLNNLVVTQLQLERIKEAEKTHKMSDKDIKVGDIVVKRDQSLNLADTSKKLKPRYRNLYFVLATSRTAAFVKLYKERGMEQQDQNTFREFLENPKSQDNKILKTFHFEKVDKSMLKKVRGIITCDEHSKEIHELLGDRFPGPVDVRIEDDQNSALVAALDSEPEQLAEIVSVHDPKLPKVTFFGDDPNLEMNDIVRKKSRGRPQKNKISRVTFCNEVNHEDGSISTLSDRPNRLIPPHTIFAGLY